MSYLAERLIEGLPPMANELYRSDWRKRLGYTRKWKLLVRMHFVKDRPESPLTKARVTLIRASAKRPDEDGLVSCFKPILDGLVECGVLADDNFNVIGRARYKWAKCPRGQGHIVVKVEAL